MAKIKIAKGNAFVYSLPLVELNADGTKENVQAADVQDLQVVCARACGASFEPEFTSDGNRLYIAFGADLQVAEYNLTVTGSLHAVQDFALQMQAAFEIVQWDSQSNWRDYIIGDAIVPEDTPLIAGVFNSDAEWERLKEELRLQIAAAQAAEAAAQAAKQEWEQKAAELDDVAQEATLTQGVQDIRTDIANIDIDTSDLAKQGTNPNANITDIQNSLSPIAIAAEAYNTGKVELAANITSKGVQASAAETLPELAEKVAAITQESYTIDGGEMYAKQLFGSLETPNYWNLYEVLANLLSDGRLINYGGILLAEYYRGYDSIALSGAGAGGAYVVSDMEDGQFKMYTEDTTHTWATEFDGKGNRWVAYCFADEYHDFQITDTNTSPRSIFIGRKVGKITSLVAGRASHIVVPDGNELKDLDDRGGQNYAGEIVIRNIVEHVSETCIRLPKNVYGVYCKIGKLNGGSLIISAFNVDSRNDCSVIVELTADENTSPATIFTGNSLRPNYSPLFIVRGCKKYIGTFASMLRGIDVFIAEDLEVWGRHTSYYGFDSLNSFNRAYFLSLESIENIFGYCYLFYSAPQYIYFGFKQNDKTKSIRFLFRTAQTVTKDIELKEGYCKPIDLSLARGLTKENVQAHIFDRLGVNDISTGTVTLTLANAVLNLFTQEEINAVVARTNITIVGG